HGPWSLYFQPHGLEARPPDWLKAWHGDGILVRIENRTMAQAVQHTGLPAVNLRVPFPEFRLPVVGLDNQALGELASRPLHDRGFKQFAFCGIPAGRYPWMDHRRTSFEQSVRASGYACHTFAGAANRQQPSSREGDQDQ